MFERIKALFAGINAAIVSFFQSKGGLVVRQALVGLLTELGPVVTDLLMCMADAAVAQVEQQSGLTSAAKKYTAVGTITTAMNASGHKLLERQINLALELAVQKLNAPPSA